MAVQRQCFIQGNIVTSAGNSWMGIQGTGLVAWTSIEKYTYHMLPLAATVIGMTVKCSAVPGAGKTRTFTLRQNSANSAVTLTLGAAESSKTLVCAVALNAGDLINWQTTQTGGAADVNVGLSLMLEYTPNRQTALMGCSGQSTSQLIGGDRFLPLIYFTTSLGIAAESPAKATVMPTSGQITLFRVKTEVGPGVGKNIFFVLRKNGADAAAVLGPYTGVGAIDVSQAIAVNFVQGDRLGVKINEDAAATNVGYCCWSALVVPTVDGENILGMADPNDQPSNAGVSYAPLCEGRDQFEGDNDSKELSYAQTLKKFTVCIETAPGAAKTWTVRPKINGAPSGISVQLGPLQTINPTETDTADDAGRNGAVYSNLDNNMAAGNIGGSVLSCAMRFRNITIPKGARISSAYITWTAQFTRGGQVVASRIYGEKAAAPAAFGAAENFGLRTLTTAFVNNVTAGNWNLNATYQSSSLITVIQELVDAYDYAAGDMVLMWLDNGSGANNFQVAWSFDSAPAKVPILHIEYTLQTVSDNVNTAGVVDGQQLNVDFTPAGAPTGTSFTYAIVGEIHMPGSPGSGSPAGKLVASQII